MSRDPDEITKSRLRAGNRSCIRRCLAS